MVVPRSLQSALEAFASKLTEGTTCSSPSAFASPNFDTFLCTSSAIRDLIAYCLSTASTSFFHYHLHHELPPHCVASIVRIEMVHRYLDPLFTALSLQNANSVYTSLCTYNVHPLEQSSTFPNAVEAKFMNERGGTCNTTPLVHK